jgi:hypothetical protein
MWQLAGLASLGGAFESVTAWFNSNTLKGIVIPSEARNLLFPRTAAQHRIRGLETVTSEEIVPMPTTLRLEPAAYVL